MALRPCPTTSVNLVLSSTKFSTQGGPRPTPASYRRNYRCIAAVPNKSHKIRKSHAMAHNQDARDGSTVLNEPVEL